MAWRSPRPRVPRGPTSSGPRRRSTRHRARSGSASTTPAAIRPDDGCSTRARSLATAAEPGLRASVPPRSRPTRPSRGQTSASTGTTKGSQLRTVLLIRSGPTRATWARLPRRSTRPASAFPRRAALEVVGDLVAGRPADAVVLVDVLDDPLVHEHDLRLAAHVRVDRHREDGVVVLAVHVVELVEPELLDVARVDEAVAVRRGLDEHHRRQVVEVPARRNLDQVGFLAAHERLHPLLRLLRVVDLRPRVSDPHVV